MHDSGTIASTEEARASEDKQHSHLRLVFLALRLVIAAGLAVDAYVHLVVASDYDIIPGTISAGSLFRLESVAAIVAGLAVLVRPGRITYLLAFLVGASALAAVVVNTNVDLGAIGPLPDLYEPVWFTEKTVSAVAEGVAAVAAALAFALTLVRPSADT
jgi:hypothetical protein